MGQQRFFIHVPKTGGSTLKRTIERWVVPDTPVWVPEKMNRTEWPDGLGTAVIAGGHRTWNDVLNLPWTWDILVLLRDPLERVLSHYSYLRMRHDQRPTPLPPHGWAGQAGTRTLADLARDPDALFFSWTGPA